MLRGSGRLMTAWSPSGASDGVDSRGAALLSKTSGVMIQAVYLNGLGEMTGVGINFEHPAQAGTTRAIGVFASPCHRDDRQRLCRDQNQRGLDRPLARREKCRTDG